MKRVTASEARRNWFRLLDEVAQGEQVFVMRHGRKIVFRVEPEAELEDSSVPDYRELIQFTGSTEADRWTWEWPGSSGGLVPKLVDSGEVDS